MPTVTLANSKLLDEHRDFIQDLYLTHGLRAKDVRQQLLALFSLQASEDQLKRKFKKWGIGKNQKGEQWSKVAQMLKFRQLDTNQASITANGFIVDASRVRRAIQRHDRPKMRANRAYKDTRPHTPKGFTISRKLVNPAALTAMNLPYHLFWEGMQQTDPYRIAFTSWTSQNAESASLEPSFQRFHQFQVNGSIHLSNGNPVSPHNAPDNQSIWSTVSGMLGLQTRSSHMVLIIARELGITSRESGATDPGLSNSMAQLAATLPRVNHFIGDLGLVSYYPGSMALPVLLSYMVFLCSNHLVGLKTWDDLIDNLLREYGLEALKYPYKGQLSYLMCFSEYMLLYAARKGRYEIVRLLRQTLPDLNRQLSHLGPPRTLLQEAIGHNQGSFCYKLLEDGVDIGYPPRPVRTGTWLGDRSAMDLAAYFIPGLFHHMLAISRQKLSFDPELLLPLAVKSGLGVGPCLYLLNAGANVNAVDSQGWTALQHAISAGDQSLVRLLLDHHAATADPMGIMDYLDAPLFLAVRFHETLICKMLIQAGADVNVCQYTQHSELLAPWHQDKASEDMPSGLFETALQCAVWDNNLQLVELLVNHGAKPALGNTVPCLMIAAWKNNWKVFELLLHCGAQVGDTCDKELFQNADALSHASYKGDVETLHILLSAGARVNPPEVDLGERWSALQVACKGGNIAAVKWLLDHGANINAPCESERGMTALQAAIGTRNQELIELLLERGADINAAPSQFQDTVLSAAVRLGSMTLLRRLVAEGAEVTFNGWNGQREDSIPLVAAAQHGRTDVIDVLMKAGLNIYAPTHADSTILEAALLHAARSHKFNVVDWFLRLGVKLSALVLSRILSSACSNGFHHDRQSLKQFTLDLIDRGVDVNIMHMGEAGRNKLTILCQVCDLTGDDPELVQLLLDRGADVNPDRTPLGRKSRCMAPLGYAAREGKVATVQLLLQHGAEVNSTASSSDWTALQHAALRGYIHIAQLLLAAGADVRIVSSESTSTALSLAVRNGRLDMVKLLLDHYQLQVGESMFDVCREYAQQARRMCLWPVVELLDNYRREEQVSSIPTQQSMDFLGSGTAITDATRILEEVEDIDQGTIEFDPWKSPSPTNWQP